MRLNLGEVAVVKIARVLYLVVLEDNDATSLVADSEVLSGFVVRYGSKQVVLRNVLLIALTKTIDIHPVTAVSDSVRIDVILALGLNSKILGRHDDLSTGLH